MKRVKCVESYHDQITVGRVYEVVDEDFEFYQIKSDLEEIGGYSKWRFEEVDTTYQLTLSEEEKDVLICILESIGGHVNSPRKFADSVYNRLVQYKTTITDPEYNDPDLLLVKYQELLKDPDATLRFNDFPPEPVKNTLSHLKISIDTSSAKKDIEELTELLKQVEVIKNRIFKEVV